MRHNRRIKLIGVHGKPSKTNEVAQTNILHRYTQTYMYRQRGKHTDKETQTKSYIDRQRDTSIDRQGSTL